MLTIRSHSARYTLTLVRPGGFVSTYTLTEATDILSALQATTTMLNSDSTNAYQAWIDEETVTKYVLTPTPLLPQ